MELKVGRVEFGPYVYMLGDRTPRSNHERRITALEQRCADLETRLRCLESLLNIQQFIEDEELTRG